MEFYDAIDAIRASGREIEAVGILLRVIKDDYEKTKATNRIYQAQVNAAMKLTKEEAVRNILETEPRGII